MGYSELALIVFLQLLIIAGAYMVFRLVARRGMLPDEIMSSLSHRDLADYLEQEINRTKAAITHPPSELPEALHLLQTRLGYLQAERRALNSSRRQPGQFWHHLGSALVLPSLPVTPPADTSPEHQARDISLDSEKQMLRDLVETYESRVDALELFRDQFFDLKEQLDSIQQKHKDLQAELDRVLPKSERSEELERINEALQREKASLEQKLEQLSREEKDAARIMTRNRNPDSADPMVRTTRMGLEAAALDSHAEAHQQQLAELKQKTQQSDGNDLIRMVHQIEQLEQKLQQIRSESQRLREENQQLQTELRNIIGTTKTKDATLHDYRETVDDLKGLVVEQKDRIRQMNEEMTSLATQAQEAGKLQQMIQEFTNKNSEMLMCIYTLEDENDFLRKQIGELLKLDSNASTTEIEQAASQLVNHEELQNQVIELETELEKRTDSFARLQKKFMSIEQKYLELYQKSLG